MQKKRNPKPFLVVLSLLVCGTAGARLDETAEECGARYGDPIQTQKEERILVFSIEGLTVSCFFDAELVCDSIAYERESGPLSAEEIAALLEKNSRSTWTSEGRSPSSVLFRSEDGILAAYDVDAGRLILSTRAGLRRQSLPN